MARLAWTGSGFVSIVERARPVLPAGQWGSDQWFPDDRPTAEELERLYSSLGAEERDDLLQEILVAWANGEAAMVVAVDAWLLDHAARAFIDEIAGGAMIRVCGNGRPSLARIFWTGMSSGVGLGLEPVMGERQWGDRLSARGGGHRVSRCSSRSSSWSH